MPDVCYASNLANNRRHLGELILALSLNMIALVALPLFAHLIPNLIPGIWPQPNELTTVGLLKISSIATLGFHGLRSAPKQTSDIFSWTFLLMIAVVAILVFYIIISSIPCTSGSIICEWPKYDHALEIVSALSFSYMFIFLFQNISIIRRQGGADLGLKLFIEGFLLGVNIPSILSFILIIVVYEYVLAEHSDIFLSGATALLVFVSSAATICIDYYAQPFIRMGHGGCYSISDGTRD